MTTKEQLARFEFAVQRKAKCIEDAKMFSQCYERARGYAYFGDAHNDPAENPEMVIACNAVNSLVKRARQAAETIEQQICQMPGYDEYVEQTVTDVFRPSPDAA